jgi:hypothetical protein
MSPPSGRDTGGSSARSHVVGFLRIVARETVPVSNAQPVLTEWLVRRGIVFDHLGLRVYVAQVGPSDVKVGAADLRSELLLHAKFSVRFPRTDGVGGIHMAFAGRDCREARAPRVGKVEPASAADLSTSIGSGGCQIGGIATNVEPDAERFGLGKRLTFGAAAVVDAAGNRARAPRGQVYIILNMCYCLTVDITLSRAVARVDAGSANIGEE